MTGSNGLDRKVYFTKLGKSRRPFIVAKYWFSGFCFNHPKPRHRLTEMDATYIIVKLICNSLTWSYFYTANMYLCRSVMYLQVV